MDVLHRQFWIGRVEPNRSAIRAGGKVDELLQVLSTWCWRRAHGELEDQIENLADVLGEVGNVGIERTVIHSEETNLVVLKRHELRKMGVPTLSRSFVVPLPRARRSSFTSKK